MKASAQNSSDWNSSEPKIPVSGISRSIIRWGPGYAKLRRAFTLIELLAVIVIIALLAALLVPALGRSMSAARRSKCAVNLQQLALANQTRADDAGFFAPAAADIWGKNLQRWHGTRTSISKAFDGTSGPLSPYLGGERMVRACPSLTGVKSGFEQGCGGYGYNAIGVGSQDYIVGALAGPTNGMKPQLLSQPGSTLMFTDAAFLQAGSLIEYSFAEPYFFVSDRPPVTTTYNATPSIHFRHGDLAGVVWCDGRVSWEAMKTSYSDEHTRNRIGWFGEADNKLFAPF
jgi:prepilin-type N-terminal cleavage/methylation domain-containing protein/prepilin-type processing-associated H-X9-DG protein